MTFANGNGNPDEVTEFSHNAIEKISIDFDGVLYFKKTFNFTLLTVLDRTIYKERIFFAELSTFKFFIRVFSDNLLY